MPGQMSNYLENALLQKVLGQGVVSFPPAGNLRLAIATALNEADDAATTTEVSAAGTAYARQSLAFTAPASAQVTNTALVSFPKATNDWGTVRYWYVADQATAGNMLYWGPIQNPMSVLTNEKLEFDPATLTVSLAGSATATLVNQILNATLRGLAWSLNPVTHVGLLSSYTGDQVFTEVADSAYARQAVNFSAASGGSAASTARIQWSAAVADYTVTHVGLFTAVNGGTLMMVQPLSQATTVQAGKNFRFEAGDLTASFD